MLAKILIDRDNIIIRDIIKKLFGKYMGFNVLYYDKNGKMKHAAELTFNIRTLEDLTLLTNALNDNNQSYYRLFMNKDQIKITELEKLKILLKKIFGR
jgi:hypothetical protein